MTHRTTALVLVKALTLVLGALITYFSARAWRRTGSESLRALAIGFGLVTLGAAIAGTLDYLLNIPLAVAVIIESTITAAGFAVITYSLYVE